MRHVPGQKTQTQRLRCTDCETTGLGVTVRRAWGVEIPEIPFCQECWRKRHFAYFNHAPERHADGRV